MNIFNLENVHLVETVDVEIVLTMFVLDLVVVAI